MNSTQIVVTRTFLHAAAAVVGTGVDRIEYAVDVDRPYVEYVEPIVAPRRSLSAEPMWQRTGVPAVQVINPFRAESVGTLLYVAGTWWSTTMRLSLIREVRHHETWRPPPWVGIVGVVDDSDLDLILPDPAVESRGYNSRRYCRFDRRATALEQAAARAAWLAAAEAQ
jgi:hypothetical protein